MSRSRVVFLLIIAAAVGVIALSQITRYLSAVSLANSTVHISVLYAPEVDSYLKDTIDTFNQAYAAGRNPITGQPLTSGEKPIVVVGTAEESAPAMHSIVSAITAPANTADANTTTVFTPSAVEWLSLANYAAGRPVFDLANSPATARTPLVLATWQSRLNALQSAKANQPIGWQQLLAVVNDPKGWQTYGITGRKDVYYVHTDPSNSASGLSALLAEYGASARDNGTNANALTLNDVNNTTVQDGVRNIENMIKQYAGDETPFDRYLAQGPDAVDFVAMTEQEMIQINQGKTQYAEAERLIALYPSEGTVWEDHPFAIPDAPWVTPDQREAAKVFTQYVLSAQVQQKVLAAGFRPVNPNVLLAAPIVPELGANPNEPGTIFNVPQPQVMAAIEQSWHSVKKRADVWLVLDTSGSMFDNDNISQARKAALAFLDKLDPQDRIGLITFDENVHTLVNLDTVQNNKIKFTKAVNALQTGNAASTYDALNAALMNLQTQSNAAPANRIQAIVLRTDGSDTGSKQTKLADVVSKITATQQNANPVMVIPIAYGDGADAAMLGALAQASNTQVEHAIPATIGTLMQAIGLYF